MITVARPRESSLLRLAVLKGERLETVEDWRRAHERFLAEHNIDDGTMIVAERPVERLS